jgi:hypothetical protein
MFLSMGLELLPGEAFRASSTPSRLPQSDENPAGNYAASSNACSFDDSLSTAGLSSLPNVHPIDARSSLSLVGVHGLLSAVGLYNRCGEGYGQFLHVRHAMQSIQSIPRQEEEFVDQLGRFFFVSAIGQLDREPSQRADASFQIARYIIIEQQITIFGSYHRRRRLLLLLLLHLRLFLCFPLGEAHGMLLFSL